MFKEILISTYLNRILLIQIIKITVFNLPVEKIYYKSKLFLNIRLIFNISLSFLKKWILLNI